MCVAMGVAECVCVAKGVAECLCVCSYGCS